MVGAQALALGYRKRGSRATLGVRMSAAPLTCAWSLCPSCWSCPTGHGAALCRCSLGGWHQRACVGHPASPLLGRGHSSPHFPAGPQPSRAEELWGWRAERRLQALSESSPTCFPPAKNLDWTFHPLKVTAKINCLQQTEPLAETSLPTFSSRHQQAGRRSTFVSWPSVPSLNTRADISLHVSVARCLSGVKAEGKKGLERAYCSLTAAQRLTAWAALF